MDTVSHDPAPRKGKFNGQNGAAHPGDGAARWRIATEAGAGLQGAIGDRRWRACRSAAKPRPGALWVALRVEREGAGPGASHCDTLDLFRARSRDVFVRRAAVRLDLAPDVIERDLDQVQGRLEALHEEPVGRARQPAHPAPDLSEAERAEALELLKSPDLLARVAADLEGCGLRGPEALVLYLAGCSRLATRPLAILVPSDSTAGKSSLPSRVLEFFPPESVFQDASASARSLQGHAENALTHKIALLSERRAMPELRFALQSLHKEGHWVTSRMGKDPVTETRSRQKHRVAGPTAIFLTTPEVGPEEAFAPPCLVLRGDGAGAGESTSTLSFPDGVPCTGEELERQGVAKERQRVHRNAQRLSEPLRVLLPFDSEPAPAPRGPARRRQRSHLNCLALASCVALLSQH